MLLQYPKHTYGTPFVLQQLSFILEHISQYLPEQPFMHLQLPFVHTPPFLHGFGLQYPQAPHEPQEPKVNEKHFITQGLLGES